MGNLRRSRPIHSVISMPMNPMISLPPPGMPTFYGIERIADGASRFLNIAKAKQNKRYASKLSEGPDPRRDNRRLGDGFRFYERQAEDLGGYFPDSLWVGYPLTAPVRWHSCCPLWRLPSTFQAACSPGGFPSPSTIKSTKAWYVFEPFSIVAQIRTRYRNG
uniref:Uncharacterized protein n=1 Tax=Candidatus Kentrum sp. MB TaxID=2138164 RepID=A0A450XJI0_9GAMM|nr:MAG: hypothetical protein BECKMB1821G_GA0114241_103617 [Candidatus Kentron sp. MB]VFK29480.1 MAG: hypothetical protein BECKMB1821I_GA0114274_101022 [Candidatus Kentron sp. MB]VFK74796.1 MAG: hypothetical protein BECKMB1821H_GA0114242_101022 [Candidatus Kentron sp. MB]